MKCKVLISRKVFPEVLERLALHCELDCCSVDETMTADELRLRLAGKHGLISMLTDRIDTEMLAAAPQLRVIANVAVGYNNIDLAACTAAGVMVSNTPGVLDETTADLAWALLMASCRRLASADRWLRAGQWQGWRLHDPWLGQDVHHATLGIVGFGRIGRAVARRAQAFSMEVICHQRRRLSADEQMAHAVRWATLDELLQVSDFVVLLVPYSAATHHLIGAREIALMKPTAHLINVARGGVVDDAALIEALRGECIAGAGLDVFEDEPMLNPGFVSLDNVTLTPHIGSSTRATRLAMAMCAAENLIAALHGERPPNLLNPEAFVYNQSEAPCDGDGQ